MINILLLTEYSGKQIRYSTNQQKFSILLQNHRQYKCILKQAVCYSKTN